MCVVVSIIEYSRGKYRNRIFSFVKFEERFGVTGILVFVSVVTEVHTGIVKILPLTF